MFNFIVRFYKRNKQNKLKHFLLHISLSVIFVAIFSRIVDYIINNLIFKTPKSNLIIDKNSFNLIYYIFAEEGFIFFLFVIVCLFLIDFFSQEK